MRALAPSVSGSHDTALDDRHERAAHLKERI